MPRPRTTAYKRSYMNYKKTQADAKRAILSSTVSPVVIEELFLKQAKLRKQHSKKYFSGKWDYGHKRAYDIAIGSAWIQRQYYEDEKVENEINYIRDENQKKEVYSLWRKKAKKDTFSKLLAEHNKIKKTRKK